MLRSFSVEQPCWSPFEVHLQVFLRTFLRLLLEKGTPKQTLFPEFFKILKTYNAEGCSLQAYNLLKWNSDTELSLEPYRNFGNSFKKFGWEFVLQPVDCKSLTLVKSEFLEISRRTTFSYIAMHMIEFTRELCRKQEYCSFSKKCSHHRRSSMTFKNSCSRVTLTGNILGGVSFQYSCRQQIGQDKLRKKNLG